MTALKLVKRRLSTRWARSDKARASRIRRAEDRELPQWPRKEQAACCLARALPDGRPVIGYCSPECVRRPA